MNEAWSPFDGGNTIGQVGSEEGTIVRDEEHQDGARITLEREARHIPYAITCGVYGWMVHTRYFNSEQAAQREFQLMKSGLEDLLVRIPEEDGKACGRFVERFP